MGWTQRSRQQRRGRRSEHDELESLTAQHVVRGELTVYSGIVLVTTTVDLAGQFVTVEAHDVIVITWVV